MPRLAVAFVVALQLMLVQSKKEEDPSACEGVHPASTRVQLQLCQRVCVVCNMLTSVPLACRAQCAARSSTKSIRDSPRSSA